MATGQRPENAEGPRLYPPEKDRGTRLPSLRAIIIIVAIVLLGLLLFLRSLRQPKPAPSKQTSAFGSPTVPASSLLCR